MQMKQTRRTTRLELSSQCLLQETTAGDTPPKHFRQVVEQSGEDRVIVHLVARERQLQTSPGASFGGRDPNTHTAEAPIGEQTAHPLVFLPPTCECHVRLWTLCWRQKAGRFCSHVQIPATSFTLPDLMRMALLRPASLTSRTSPARLHCNRKRIQ